jgi:farnesyl-diphosphate farnesyltransferase
MVPSNLGTAFADPFNAALIALLVLGLVLRAAPLLRARQQRSAEEAFMDGADAEQVMMMEERVILVDAEDNVLGHESKKNTHLNSQIDGKNLLHRAFSVFLFNDAGELLMQQRSDDKITFPLFWANSCCSHPLYRPEELEKEGHLGVKRAAVRKIEQELGIDPSLLPLDCFTFVTRVYYKARSDEVWGEHEIDHILVCRPPADVLPHINTNECKDARYFSAAELDAFVEQSDANGDLVSPWFRVIHREKLPALWDATMSGNLASVIEEDVIHREEGVATNYCTGGDTTTTSALTVDPVLKTATTTTTTTNPLAKQGAYGKVGVHKHGKLQQLRHLDEVWHMLVYKLGPALGTNHMIASGNADDLFCDEILGKVSRSFAGVIRGLPACLQLDVCVFYLALRGLDTVEDDMDTSHISVADKLAELHAFHEHLSDPSWSIHGVGDGDERRLVENFGHVARAFLSLAPASQAVIADITARMGGGMAEFIAKDLGQGTADLEEYGRYCHFVAGLVGEGLSRLFASSGLEAPAIAEELALSDSMGRFLQKTNIIRDYLEDYVDGRAFWPKEIWGLYAPTGELGDFAKPPNREAALCCLNHMVLDALALVPHCIAYLEQVTDGSVFRFCAIPQVMAIATLQHVFDNEQVFTGVCKIRRGLSAKLLRSATDMGAVRAIFTDFLQKLAWKAALVARRDGDARNTALAERVMETVDVVAAGIASGGGGGFGENGGDRIAELTTQLNKVAPIVFVGAMAYLRKRAGERQSGGGGHLPKITELGDVIAVAIAIAVTVYLLAFSAMPLAMVSNGDGEDGGDGNSAAAASSSSAPKSVGVEKNKPVRRAVRSKSPAPRSRRAATKKTL